MTGLLSALLACGVIGVYAEGALAQRDTATAIGTVSDAQGAVLPGAIVTAVNAATGVSRAVVTDAEGVYRLAALPPGTYEFRAELAGFAPASRTALTLALGAEIRWQPDVVTWVPTTRRRRMERGYDQAELLARSVARYLGVRARPVVRTIAQCALTDVQI